MSDELYIFDPEVELQPDEVPCAVCGLALTPDNTLNTDKTLHIMCPVFK